MQVTSKIRDYTVTFAQDAEFVRGFERFPNRVYIVDENVWQAYAGGVLSALDPARVIIQPVNEERKNLASVEALYDQLLEHPAKRNLTLISIGPR